MVVGENRSGALIHLDDIPDGFDYHDAVAVDADRYFALLENRSDLKSAAEDMVLHHATLHPITDCEWAQRLLEASKRT